MTTWLGQTIARLIILVVATFICFLPLELFLLLTKVLNPTGFWEKLVTVGIGLWIGGGIQLILGIAWLFVMYWLTFGWSEVIREANRSNG